ncbi:predicted protein [Aspergillus nidulans FGSC A4]|uniref:Austinoid biosynthesis clusters protein H n=1 Tax=Emericella nidulans (strain FGSC A4 / ATCC 38163 / CBS 112.46 / NRRL 194 / M139) TaxID=227321 RepID=AUSH_EMENI|nr:protein ausH [Aspergillus nidulans FGSC A4]Q5AR31.1 RecName: Full=Austinoid biosynthesis clusters protein H [Aspergillus nidulans FGSC A4]EAA66316.1 predicted protein [Aspergillus nidulans FGSC A4]CBF87245.1 TPA: conserved hypothetical protein [Aspergillus nidulans FGSC A4]|eukprot:XP_682518.1 predicted protein [Aspergillus nidulans FGSC A4]
MVMTNILCQILSDDLPELPPCREPSKGMIVGNLGMTSNTMTTEGPFAKLDVESVLSFMSPSCTLRSFPSSLGKPALQTKEESKADFQGLKDFFYNFQLRVKDGAEPVIDEPARKVVLHIEGKGDSLVGRFETEYVYILQINEEGTMVEDFFQFADSATRDAWGKKIEAHFSARN